MKRNSPSSQNCVRNHEHHEQIIQNFENFVEKTTVTYSQFGTKERQYLRESVANASSILPLHPEVAISWMKFPEDTMVTMFDEEMSFDAQVLWNYEMDKMSKFLSNLPKNEQNEQVQKIQKKLLKMFEEHSKTVQALENIKSQTKKILDE